jgi:hypothetical protein
MPHIVDSLDDAENCGDSLDDAENTGFRSHEIASRPKMRGNGGTIGNGRIA